MEKNKIILTSTPNGRVKSPFEQMYEVKCYHKSTTVDKAWVRVSAFSKEDAIKQVEDGNGDWMDSKNVDMYDGEFIDKDEWTVEAL